ncbi:MAG: hypothetical protein ACFKPT_07945 [Gloeotrichia echinulata GP01]|jgi:hypothetical protein
MTTEQTQKETKQDVSPTGIFQAIGVVTGDVQFIFQDDKNKYIANITIGQYQYNLYPIGSGSKSNAFNGLRKYIESTGISKQKLIVYPKVTHYPGKEQQHKIAFQLVAFEKQMVEDLIEKEVIESSVSRELNDFEFKLSGLWQFIPVCRTPCITVMKNFSDERLQYIKQAELTSKVNFMKASHIPLIWKDALVNPFRFNPKAEKEQQGKAMFVSIKARFIPGRDVFGFDSLVAIPQEEAPKYLKAGKKDKAEALKSKLANKRQNAGNEQIPQKVKPKVIVKKQDKTETSSAPEISKPKLKPKG